MVNLLFLKESNFVVNISWFFGNIGWWNFILFIVVNINNFFLILGIWVDIIFLIWVNVFMINIFGIIGFLGKCFWKWGLLKVIFLILIVFFFGIYFMIWFIKVKGYWCGNILWIFLIVRIFVLVVGVFWFFWVWEFFLVFIELFVVFLEVDICIVIDWRFLFYYE